MKLKVVFILLICLIPSFLFSEDLIAQPKIHTTPSEASYQWVAFFGPDKISELEFYKIAGDQKVVEKIEDELQYVSQRNRKAKIFGNIALVSLGASLLTVISGSIFDSDYSNINTYLYPGFTLLGVGATSGIVSLFYITPDKNVTPYFYAKKVADNYNSNQ